MRSIHSRLITLCLAALLTACASSRAHQQPKRLLLAFDGPVAHAPSAVRPRLVVRAVNLPDYLDRRELMRRSGANEVTRIEGAVWAERPGKAITRFIAQALAAERPEWSVEAYSTADGRAPDAVLALTLEDFAPALEGALHLRGSYVFAPFGKTAVQSGRFDADASSALASPEAHIAALQLALGEAVKKLAPQLPALTLAGAQNH